MKWDKVYIYPIIAAAGFITLLFFNEEKVTLPQWPTLFTFLFFIYAALDQSFEAWRRKGRVVYSDLGGQGGVSGFNPSGDKRVVRNSGKRLALAYLATGGFVYAGVAIHGSENFIICPPEHILSYDGNLVVTTHLRNVEYRELHGYMQDELKKLPGFKRSIVDRKHNLWFGITSSYIGNDTQESFKIEQGLIDDMSLTSEYKKMYEDLMDKKSAMNRFRGSGEQSKYKIVESWKDEEK